MAQATTTASLVVTASSTTDLYSTLPSSFSSDSSISTTIFSITPLPPPTASTSYESCPTEASQICGSQNQTQTGTTCSSNNGTAYNVNCGIVYVGTEVNESDIHYPPQQTSTTSSAAASGMKRGLSGVERTFDYCQEMCDWTPSCVAINFMDGGCDLLQNVTGHQEFANAMRAQPIPVYTPLPPEPSHLDAMTVLMSSPDASVCSRRVVTGTYMAYTAKRELG